MQAGLATVMVQDINGAAQRVKPTPEWDGLCPAVSISDFSCGVRCN